MRVFDVAEPVGPLTTVLVYVPTSRFAATLPDRVAELVRDHYGGEIRDPETLLGTSSLARISMTVRATRAVDLDLLGQAIDRASETWEEQARRALVEAIGPTEGPTVFDLVGVGTTAEYRARTRPAEAVADLTQRGEPWSPTVQTSQRRSGAPTDASDDDWRFRVYFRGEGSTLAELVPILGQLGLRAIEEHPTVFTIAEPLVPPQLVDRAVVDERDPLTFSLVEIVVRAGTGLNEIERRHRRAATGRAAASVRRPRDRLDRVRWSQPVGAGRRARHASDRRAPALPPVSPPGRLRVQRAVRRTVARQAGGDRPFARRVVRGTLRPHAVGARRRGGSHPRLAARAARCRSLARRRPDLPRVPHVDRRHRADQRVPRPRRDRGEAPPEPDRVPPRAPTAVRDLRVLALRRRCAPAWRPDRPWWAALERAARRTSVPRCSA